MCRFSRLSELYVYDDLGGHAGYTVWPPFPERLIMRIPWEELIVTACVVVAFFIGYARGTNNIDPDAPVDPACETSIIVDFDNGDWVELRGPGRFEALELFGEVVE